MKIVMKRLLLIGITCLILTGCSAKKVETEKKTEVATEAITEEITEEITEIVAGSDKKPTISDFIEHVKQEVANNNLSLTYPEVNEWTVLEIDGYMSVSVSAKKKDKPDIVTAWIELDNSTIHYLDTADGVLIDDGVIED